MALKLIDVLRFVRLLKVEPYIFLVMFIYVCKRLPLDQLIQDKLCLQKYHMSKNYCFHLPVMKDEEDTLNMKSTILTDVTQFNMYINIAITAPMLIISLLVGPFIDRNIHGKRIMLLFSALLLVFEQVLLLVNCYFYQLKYNVLMVSQIVPNMLGSVLICMSSGWSYVTTVTPKHLVAIRLTVLEIFLFAASPIATLLSGSLLQNAPLFESEMRNYSTLFILASSASIAGFILIYFLIDEQFDKQLFIHYFSPQKTDQSKKIPIESFKVTKLSLNEKLELPERPVKEVSIVRQFLDIGNIKEMVQTLFKQRPHQIRMQILLLFLALMLYLLAYLGPSVFLFQYVQKVYHWNSKQYSFYYAISSVINMATSLLLVPILLRVLKGDDINFALIGLNILFIQNAMRILSPSLTLFYASLAGSTLNSVSSVGIRTYLSKIIEPGEMGRIFSLMSAIDSSLPLLASVIFSNVFRLTIDTMPNMSFAAVSVGLLIAILCLYVIGYKAPHTLKMLEQERQEQLENSA